MTTQGHRKKHISYDYWGWLFLLPFFLAFFIFTLIPLIKTFVYSFQDYYYSPITFRFEGPTFCGWNNYQAIFTQGQVWTFYLFDQVIGSAYMPSVFYYLINTLIIFVMGFIPQIIVSLLLSIWFTDIRLKLHGKRFFKTVMYMPNLIMAAAFGLLFQLLFSTKGPINQILMSWGWLSSSFSFRSSEFWTRLIIALINFLMWFGNTTLLLMSGVMGIDDSVFESALLDGSSARHTFWTITFPLLKPIFIYVFMTSLIGGVQLFDTAYMFTNANGNPNLTSYTIMQYLFTEIHIGQDYGISGALSVFMFLVTALLSMAVYWTTQAPKNSEVDARRQRARRFREYSSCAPTIEEKARYYQKAPIAKEVR